MTSSPVAQPPAPTIEPAWWRRTLFTPVLAPVLRDRRVSLALAGVTLVQTAAALFGWRTFDCPMLRSTGLPCPGCGLSRACGAFVRGDWRGWTAYHALAPVFLLGGALLFASLCLPAARRHGLTDVVDSIERRSGLVPLLVTTVFVYWLARLLYSGGYVALMRG